MAGAALIRGAYALFGTAITPGLRLWLERRSIGTGDPPELVVDQPGELVGCTTNRLVERGGVVGHRDGLAALEPRFHGAAFVARAGLAAVLVAQVDLHACHLVLEPPQGMFHGGTDVDGQRLAALDVGIGIHLDLHGCAFAGDQWR